MIERNDNVQLLSLLVDWEDVEDSDYRFLVDGKNVKYVTTAPGIFPQDDRTFAPILIPLLPPFPPGDWNEGYVSKDKQTAELCFSRTIKRGLLGVRDNWHPVKIDHLELTEVERFRQNIQKVTCPRFPHPVVFKFAEFPWQIPYLESETDAYELIDGTGIGPNFLGHVTEAGRTIGFLVDHVGDAGTAGPEDLAACQSALSRLHTMGYRHGDINKHNFLVGPNGATIVDFETMKRCDVTEELKEEYDGLEKSLNDTSHRGGVGEVRSQPPP